MNVLQRVRGSVLLRHNMVLFAGSLAVGVLNYVYYPVMGRLLPPAAFGEVQTLISLFLQVAIFLSVLGLVTINVVANYRSDTQRNAVVLEFEHLALFISLAVLLVAIMFQNQLKHFLHFDAAWPFVLLAMALVASVPLTFRSAFLRGKQWFGRVSVTSILSAGGKLVGSIALVALGFGTAGAIGGLVAAQVVASIVAGLWAKRGGLLHPAHWRAARLPDFKVLAPELRYGLLVCVASLFVTIQYSIDVVVVKHFFDPHTAGLYAAVASVARILFFLTASIALVLMPLVRMAAKRGANRQLLLRSLGLFLIVSVPVLVLFVVAPGQVMGALMGKQYGGVAILLPRLSLAVFTVSLVNLVVAYYLALRQYVLAPVVGIGGVVTYVLLAAHHGTLSAVVNSLLLGSVFMLCCLLVWVGVSKGARI